MAEKTEAQRLADVLDLLWLDGQTPRKAAAELRRLESVNKQLLEAVESLAAADFALLEALEDVCTQFLGRGVTVDPEHPDHVALKKAEAAIAAAKGEA